MTQASPSNALSYDPSGLEWLLLDEEAADFVVLSESMIEELLTKRA